jgi:predicted Ser/Thr protein kinase
MDKRYELFCIADPLFYDSPHANAAARRDFTAAARPPAPGWNRIQLGEWQVEKPPHDQVPALGWKIHVSACLDNAERVLDEVIDYCVPRQVSFKFLRRPLSLFARNAKYAPRGSSGKLVTIYPADDACCERILAELDAIIGGEQGPYILSDLRYSEGPLYVRYGAFTERYCRDSRGDLVPAIEDPSGNLVPDRRTPVFTVPDWVTLPGFLAPHLAARNAAAINDLPYRVERALHFSNGGGVYQGTDPRTGESVVLKEARPHAGLAADGADAVTRLRREHDTLRLLAGLGVAPEVRDYFEAGDHHFLVEDYIDGAALNSLYAHRHPMIEAAPSERATAEYTRWALHVCASVERAVEAIHGRGVVVNDLHMFNIMVRPDDSVALIDFEAAAPVEAGTRPTLGNPGFLAPRDRTGFGIDRYSLACVKLAMFLPLTTLFPFDPGKAAHLADVIAEHFPVPRDFLDHAVHEITGTRETAAGRPSRPPSQSLADVTPDQAGWERARRSLVRAIQASATPSREDRLFPGDVEQFSAPSGGLSMAYGAAGVLYALSEAGAQCPDHHVEWLVTRSSEPLAGARLGLYDGMTGVAWALQLLGRRAAAVRVAEICLAERWERLGDDLHGGLSGIALALLDLADTTGEVRLREAGLRAAGIVADHALLRPAGHEKARAGLLRGCTGRALLFVRMFERTGDRGYLDLADAALHTDLDRCVLSDRGALQVDEGWRVMPYLDGGSAGIGMVIDEYLAHRDDAGLRQAGRAIEIAASSAYYAQAGLFKGRAGMMLYLAHGHGQGLAAADPRIAAHVRRMAWHAIGYQGGVAFPGDSLFRLSMDLATGTAGVLLAMAAALSPQGGTLPLHTRPARPLRGPSARPAHGPAHPAHVAADDVAGVHLTDVPGGNGQGLGTKPRIARR